MVLKRIKRGIQNLTGGEYWTTEEQTVVDHKTSRNLERLEDDVKKGRGEAEAGEAEAKRDLKQLEEQVESGRNVEVPQYLQTEREQLRDQDWKGGLSFRKLFAMLLTPSEVKQAGDIDIQIQSYDEKRSFGNLYDFWMSKTGLLALVNEDMDRVASGNDMSKLNASPGGARNQMESGYWRASITKDKQPIAPTETATVPKMIEVDGEIMSLSSTRENYLEQGANYTQRISQLENEKESLEKELEKVIEVAQDESLEKKIATSALDINKTRRMKHVEEGVRAKRQFDQMQSKISRTTSESQMKEDLVKDMWAEKEKWNRLYAEQYDDDELDIAEDKIHRIATMLVGNFDKLANVNSEIAEAQQSSEGGSPPSGQNQGQQGRGPGQ